MFSAEQQRPHSTRPKRNRQSAGKDEPRLPLPKRKRLQKDTYEPLTEASLNEVAGRDITESKSHGQSTQSAQSREITIRSKKLPEKRSERGATAALTLTNNDFYTVNQLPALPDQIRNHPSLPYSCVICPEYGYALALTHSDALIWPFNSSASTPSLRDIITFKLPFPPASVNDPLPVAAFTARSASGEPGLVVISSRWGKIVYWETLSSASSFIPGQAASGIQASIPNYMSSEVVEEVINAEPSGFILALRTGRVAHLTLRDQMGRPNIGVMFLRKDSNVSGIFGSIRNVLAGHRGKGTAIIKAGGSRKGQRDIVVATEDANLEFWNTNATVGNSLETSFSFKEEILEALKALVPDTTMNFKVLDLELSAGPSTARRESRGAPMMVLVSLSVQDRTRYYLVEMVVDQEAKVKVVHPIKCYQSPITEQESWRPRLCLSKSQPVAFILFENAVVLFSLARIRESPSSQLLMERHSLPDPFQDIIRFQEGTIYKILGHALETGKQATVLFGVQGFGIVRLSSHLGETEELDVDDLEERITAKSKIEQAIFFGTIKQNPFDLKNPNQTFSRQEVEKAAIEISLEILSSTSKYLPRSTPQIEQQMRLRAKAMDDLVSYVLSHYSISRVARFELLLNAEKLAGAQAIWKTQEAIQRKYPRKDREMSYLDFTLRALHESRQKYPNADKGENDRVRHWLVNSVEMIGYLMSELVSCIKELAPMDVTDPNVVADYLLEAVDIWIATYQGVFKFREDNAPHYGLSDEVFEDGVLKTGFPVEIPHPWTSVQEPFGYAQELIYHICKFLEDWKTLIPKKKKKAPTNDDGKPYDAPNKGTIKDLASRLYDEVLLFSKIAKEEAIQAELRLRAEPGSSPDVVEDEVRAIRKEYRDRLRHVLVAISKFNIVGAIQLAETFQDFGALVDLHYAYYRHLQVEIKQDPSLQAANTTKLEEMQDRAETYFERFGKGWAYANFSQLVADGEYGSLLLKGQEDQSKQKFLNWFFRKSQKLGQRLGKLSWISDVISSANFARAEKTLLEVAQEETGDVWNKKIQLSLAKLAGLAAGEEDRTKYDRDIELISIQELVHSHVAGVVGPTVDDKAAIELGNEIFASKVVSNMPGLGRQLKIGLSMLLKQAPLSAEELVDVLTLMDPVEFTGSPEDEPGVLGREFALALKVVDFSGLSQSSQDNLRTIIWRRAMIRDDWAILNETGGKADEEVEAAMQETSLFKTLQLALLEQLQNGDHLYLVSPSEILDKDVFPKDVRDRCLESDVEAIEKDMVQEQAKLRKFVETGRLDEHYGGLVTSAEKAVRAYQDQQGDAMAQDLSGVEESNDV
ncbi:hypothetical protein B0A52_03820 [Exophiala mesophila]|uniref:Nucleoporin Nup133/Nup155-like C-terminal domain-containing protein n=1 Tax=Exophiala mesophila TaxID=212818 RepID=A0A438N7L1_EXOME|nr:hypothetical protein B0A52_03820 [Exophiala mesophila]